jgi:hypothetical protein
LPEPVAQLATSAANPADALIAPNPASRRRRLTGISFPAIALLLPNFVAAR